MAVFNIMAGTTGALGLMTEPGNVGGLALANTLGVLFEVLVLGFLLRTRWRGLNENQIAQTTAKTLAASLAMGLVVLAVEAAWAMFGLTGRGFVFIVAQIGVQVVLGVAAFGIVAVLLKMDELKTLTDLLLRRRPLAKSSV